MVHAESAMKHMLCYYAISITAVILITGVGAWKDRHDAKKMDSSLLLFCAGCIAALLQFVVGVVPLSKDYIKHNIIQTEGIYINHETGHTGSPSTAIGLYSVTLTVNGEDLKLTTVPFHSEIFVGGSYHVTAYYAPISKTLLHIELIDEIDTPSESN